MPRQSKPFRSAIVRAMLAVPLIVVALFVLVPGLNSVRQHEAEPRIAVHRGDSFRQIVESLHDAGAVRFRWPLLAAGVLNPKLRNIKPGRYTVPRNLSSIALLDYLHSRPQDEVRLMIPNGVEQTRIASIIAGGLDIDSTAFMAATRDPKLLQSLGIEGHSTEGYLFPGTYNFPWASTPDEVVTFLTRQFRSFYSESLQQRAKSAGLDENRLLTLASIVEAETPLDEEKPVVASVYLNRLKRNMRLQADPTVQYAIPGPARRLLFKDLEIDSPYNTYRNAGLPPGPICNPGPASINAVLNPARTNYLYFVATGRGGHAFASTLAGHAQNVQHYRSVRAKLLREQAQEADQR